MSTKSEKELTVKRIEIIGNEDCMSLLNIMAHFDNEIMLKGEASLTEQKILTFIRNFRKDVLG